MIRLPTALAAFALTWASVAHAASHGTREEAVAMVHRVQAMFSKDGAKKTFAAIDDLSYKSFHDRDLYPFVYSEDGVNVAHGARPALVGHNLMNIKDADGKYLIKDMVRLVNTSGSGWIGYKWPDPLTGRIENKSSYVEKMGRYIVGVGVYMPDAKGDD